MRVEFSSATIDGVLTNGDRQPMRSEIAEKAAAVVENLGKIIGKEYSSAWTYSGNESNTGCNCAPDPVSMCTSRRSYREGMLSIYEEMLCKDQFPEERKIQIRAGIIPMLVYSITEDVKERICGSRENILLRLHTNKIEEYHPGRWEESLERLYQKVSKD